MQPNLSYPFVKCEVTGQIRPGYALCVHLAGDPTDGFPFEIGDMKAPTKKSLGVIICKICMNRANAALVVCCGPCVEAGLLKGMAQA